MNLIPVYIYLTLFLITFLPLIMGFEPFTAYFARKKSPSFVWKSNIFRRMNMQMTFFWNMIFLFNAIFAYFFRENILLTSTVPQAAALIIGIPFNIFYPRRFFGSAVGSGNNFSDVNLSQMPLEILVLGLEQRVKKEKLFNLDSIYQLNIHGSEKGNWIIFIKNNTINIVSGIHQNPSITIDISDSDWRDLACEKEKGDNLIRTEKMKVRGDLAKILEFKNLFGG